MFGKKFLLGLFLIASSNLIAQSNLLYSQSNLTTVISGTNPEYPSYLVTDSSGNLISTGAFTANMSATNVSLTNSGENDIFVIKYNNEGTAIWSRKIGGDKDDLVNAISTDTSGNIFIAGTFKSTNISVATSNETLTLSTHGTSDFFIAKYDSNGNLLWIKSNDAAGEEAVTALTTDSQGNVYIGGTFNNSNLILGETTLTKNAGYDTFLAKLDSSGNFIWAKGNGAGASDEIISSLTVDNSNNLYFSGNYDSEILTIGNKSITNTPAQIGSAGSFLDSYVGKLDTNGTILWLKNISGIKNETANGLVLDSNNNIYIVGSSQSTSVSIKNIGATPETLTVNAFENLNATGYLAKFDTDGLAAWIQSFSGSGNAITKNSNNLLYLSSSFLDYRYSTSIQNKIYAYNLNGELNKEFSVDSVSKSLLSTTTGDVIFSTYKQSIKIAKVSSIFKVDADGDHFIDDNQPMITGLETPEGYIDILDSIGQDCDDTNKNKGYSYVYYTDADGDGFGGGTAMINCTGVPSGYVSNGSDCDDNNPNLNPSITEIYFDNIDQDCNGSIDDAKIITTDISGKATLIYSQEVANAESYLFEVISSTGVTKTIVRSVNNFTIDLLNFPTYSINDYYFVSVKLKYNGIWKDFGPQTKVYTQKGISKVSSKQCSASITDLQNYIVGIDFCAGGAGYKIYIANNVQESFIINTNSTNFNFSSLPDSFKKNSTSFQIFVKVKGTNGEYTPDGYSTVCTLNVKKPKNYSSGTGQIVAPQITTTTLSNCDSKITTLTSAIKAIAVIGATQYQFEVTEGSTSRTYISDTNSFNLTQLEGGALFSTVYNVKVAIKLSTETTFGSYSSSCKVTTPSYKVIESQCGSTITALYSNIYSNYISDATAYRFEITKNGVTKIVESTTSAIKLPNIADFTTYNSTYTIRVAIKYNDIWQPYGASCNITTPDVAKSGVIDSQCSSTLATLSSSVKAKYISGATGYRFEITKNGSIYTIDSPTSGAKLTKITGLATYGATYSIRVAIQFNGSWQSYGTACNVSTPAFQARINTEEVGTVFIAKTYPNPFDNAFNLDIESNNDETIIVNIYDMLGKLIEAKDIEKSSLNNTSFGNDYATGIYNVIVSQGNNYKTLRVIKK